MMNAWKTTAILLTGLAAIGCGEEDGTQSASGAAEPLILFKDPATTGLRLDVYEVEGRAAVSVGGPIGTEGRIARISGLESLAELYRILHPDITEIPTALPALNERVISERAELDGAPRSAVETPEIPKTNREFDDAFCVRFLGGGASYTPVECVWDLTTAFLNVCCLAKNDRVYAWNPNPRTATLRHRLVSGFVWSSLTIPQSSWKYMTITRDGPFMTADLIPAGSVRGELGLTHHVYAPIIH